MIFKLERSYRIIKLKKIAYQIKIFWSFLDFLELAPGYQGTQGTQLGGSSDSKEQKKSTDSPIDLGDDEAEPIKIDKSNILLLGPE